MRDIGKNIRDLRAARGLTQEELAGALFVTRQTVSNYETGRTRPDVDTIVRMGEVLGADANAILYGPPEAEDHRRNGLRLGASSVLLLILVLARSVLVPLSAAYARRTYIMAPVILVRLYLFPLQFLALGWWLAELVWFLFRPKFKVRPWFRRAGCVVLICLGLIGLVGLPLGWVNVRALFSGQPYGLAENRTYMAAVNWILYSLNGQWVGIYTLLAALLRFFFTRPEKERAAPAEQA